ncbi:hypothetical protein ACHAWF_002324 [Thalassiosira exigua]
MGAAAEILNAPLAECGHSNKLGNWALPHPTKWPHRPIHLVADERVDVKFQRGNAAKALPLGKPIEFETDWFKGRFFLRLRNARPHHDDSKKHAAHFKGNNQLYQMVIQGRFKDPSLTFADIVVGDVYERKLKRVPHGTTGKLIKKFVESVSPGIMFDVFDDEEPKVLTPLGGCQTLSVDLTGTEPTDFDAIVENTKLLGEFSSEAERRKRLVNPATAAGHKVDTGHVYTFVVSDHVMDFATYHQHLRGGFQVDLMPSLDGQHMSLGIYTRKLKCLCKFILWHEQNVCNQADP